MKIGVVITDANILIDLIHLEMFSVLFESDLFEFKTTDFVFEELYDGQKEILRDIIEEQRFQIIESQEDDLTEIFKIKQNTQGLSIQDCSAWFYAQKLNGMLLTGDASLRKHTKKSGIEVHGILYLFDRMVAGGIIAAQEAFEKLEELKVLNKRLPVKEVEKRLKEWGSP